jgi:uncharacterized protein involved in outer membrane biogenesis
MNATPSKSPLGRPLVLVPLVLVALVAVAWIALMLALPPARVKSLVEAQLRTALRREARFERASVGLFPPVRLSVRRLELAEPGGFANGTALSAGTIDLDLDVFALLSKQVRVKRLAIGQPVLHVVLRADGSTNLDSLGAPPPPGAPAPAMDLDVREFAIRDGRVLVDDLRAGRRTALGLETTTSLQAEGGGTRIATSGTTEVTGLSFGPLSAARLSDLNQGLAKLVFHLEHKGKFDAKQNRLALERLALGLGRTQVVLSGLVDDVGPRARFDLRAKGQGLDFGDLLSWVGVADARAVKGISGRGTMAFDLAAKGAAAAPGAAPAIPAVTGWLTVKDAAFKYAGAPVGVEALSFSTRFTPDTVVIPDLQARVSGQPVRARLRAMRFADPLVDFAVQGNLDLAAVAPLVAAQGAKVTGRANLDVRGAGRAKDPGAMALDGRAELKDVSVETKDLPKKVEAVNGVVLLSPQRAAVQHLTARAGKSSYTLDATVTRPLALLAKPDSVPPAGVTFDFRSPHLDLAELLPTTPGAPFLPNARGGGTVHIDRLVQGKLDVKDVDATVALAPAALDASAFSLRGYGGAITGSAKFDLRDTRKPVYEIRSKVANVQADSLLSAWTPAKGLLRGTLSTDLTFSGAGQQPDDLKRTLTLVGLAALSQGQLGPGPALQAIADLVKVPQLREVKFKELKLPMRIERGRLITDAVTMTGPSGEWQMSGAVGFDGALDYAVSVTLPPDVAAALDAKSALAAGALADDRGRMLLDLHVGGTAKAPRVAWNTQAMRDRLAGRASQALAEQKTKLEAETKAAAMQALQQKLGLSADSTRQSAPVTRDSLAKAAGSAVKDFFGSFGRKKSAPAAPAPTPAPVDTTKK